MRPATLLATWFGCGRSPVAPGTAGTLGALPVVALGMASGSLALQALLAAGAVIAGLVVARDLAPFGGRPDPPQIVIDEVAGMLVAALGLPLSWPALVVAFALFRAFDVLKPWPCRRLERLPSSWGIMSDDLLAGAWACLGTHLLLRLVEIAA